MGRTNTTKPAVQKALACLPRTIQELSCLLGLSRNTIKSCLADHPNLFKHGHEKPFLWSNKIPKPGKAIATAFKKTYGGSRGS